MVDVLLMDTRPLILLDFNGTVHRYSRGWQDGVYYDPPTEGFKEWAVEATKEFRIALWPARAKSHGDIQRVRKWLLRHGLGGLPFDVVTAAPIGPRLKIDDRALTFTGDWADFPMERLRNFKTWSGR
jgi:hypothetical protein